VRTPLERGAVTGLIAIVALVFGFVAAAQLRTQLITPSNRVERNQALVRSVQELELVNANDRQRITQLRGQISGQEAKAAERDAATRQLRDEVATLRAHAGETALRGPGVTVDLGSGRPSGNSSDQSQTYLADFQDVQDVVNLLFAAGAEGVAVSGRRVTPLSGFHGQAGTAVIDQGPPLLAPFRVAAVGNRSQMEATLNDTSALGDLRYRQRQYGVQFSWNGSPSVALPANDSGLEVSYAQPG
jgi:uncharacterized protein YlxW (UPF0749 family)